MVIENKKPSATLNLRFSKRSKTCSISKFEPSMNAAALLSILDQKDHFHQDRGLMTLVLIQH